MKLLLLLGLALVLPAFGQVDLPVLPKGNKEILSFLWVKHELNTLDPIEFHQLAEEIEFDGLSQIDEAKLQTIENSFLIMKNESKILINSLTEAEAIQYINSKDILDENIIQLSKNAIVTIDLTKIKINKISKFSPLSITEMKDLIYRTPDLAHYNNGEYKDTVRLFLFCRESRDFPCLFVMKDIFGNIVKENGKVWSLPALAKSARNIPYYKTNGQTPNGVHTIDSVMPEANRQTAFGKFRRVMLDWIPKSQGELNTKHFLPISHTQLNWWKRANVARDAGRLYLRIHGTGRVNDEPSSTYFPHMPTSGCISTREGKYGAMRYTDQRKVLDKLMEASQLKPVYSNEPNIKGVLYVVNIDDQKKSVKLLDLKKYGVE
ncbi:MAG: hypothetical protein ACJAS4_000338 [Bacteriovoracaceae bacterium]|jgi:hypothetical protein